MALMQPAFAWLKNTVMTVAADHRMAFGGPLHARFATALSGVGRYGPDLLLVDIATGNVIEWCPDVICERRLRRFFAVVKGCKASRQMSARLDLRYGHGFNPVQVWGDRS